MASRNASLHSMNVGKSVTDQENHTEGNVVQLNVRIFICMQKKIQKFLKLFPISGYHFQRLNKTYEINLDINTYPVCENSKLITFNVFDLCSGGDV
jgi:hypothetical protein